MNDVELVQIRYRIKQNQRPRTPCLCYSLCFFHLIGGICTLIRRYCGLSYEEAGILFIVEFWGSYLIAILLFEPIVMWQWFKDWGFIRDIEKLKEELALRGVVPEKRVDVAEGEKEQGVGVSAK